MLLKNTSDVNAMKDIHYLAEEKGVEAKNGPEGQKEKDVDSQGHLYLLLSA